MKKLLLLTSIVFLFLSCDDKLMEEEDNLIEESLKADNPFLGTWECLNRNYPVILVFDEIKIRLYAKNEQGNYTITDNLWAYKFTEATLTTVDSLYISERHYSYNFSESPILNLSGDEYKKISLKTDHP